MVAEGFGIMDWSDHWGLRERGRPRRPTRPSMVMPWALSVHAERAIPDRRPAFPQVGAWGRPAPSPSQRRPRPQSWGINCAQIAIIATKSAIDVSAAASSTNVFNMAFLLMLEHKKNIVPLLFQGVK